ncbi:NAD(P)-dependent oxidoreductase [Pedobacter sp. SL55]|uniref:NAD(P)-dependent oxidoreductase n=1 Tax=Pedobacter sp. SL55 TaxID=2995161 RepID=UPI0022717B95|nr:NAD(P)H-binding protein [Pedobacter sp. SL55]WAC39508.1 NAD(P)H-binding protein [Pedobacter sp. SL55]
MKVAVIGATGFVGQNLVNELANRGHEVLAIARNTDKVAARENVKAVSVDVVDQAALAAAVNGNDVVVSAFNPGWTNPNIFEDFIKGAEAIQAGVKASDVSRLIVIGGAGSLYIDGHQLVDGPGFPSEIKPGATAARDYLNTLKEEKELNWTFFSPAIEMHPGITIGRTGKYRLGLENPVFDEVGKCVLSVEDLAIVIADEVESNRHPRQRFTAAY